MKNKILWVLRLAISAILLQTLYYKFTAHPDSVFIFESLGVEPFGRIGLGIIEFITAILILINSTRILGLLLSLLIILGAIFSHFIVLGLQIANDGGGLFSLAIIVFICSVISLIILKEEVLLELKKIFPKFKLLN